MNQANNLIVVFVIEATIFTVQQVVHIENKSLGEQRVDNLQHVEEVFKFN